MKSKILLVDDDDITLELLKECLKEDYTLVFAKNGPKALSLAAEKPDLILLDIMMPGMDGYEVCRRLKANAQTKDIPVIFVTSKREVEDEIDGLKIGGVDYITKPISHLEVKARVRTYLALRAASQCQLQQSGGSRGGDGSDDSRVDRLGFVACRDLHAPIDSMLKVVDVLLRDATLSMEQKRPLLAVRNYGFHAFCMVNLVLEFAAMEQGTYQFKPSNVDLVPLIRNVRALIETLIRSKKLTLKIQLLSQVDIDKNTFIVRGDRVLCYSVLACLVKNAIEASPPGQIVTISMEDAGRGGIVRINNQGAVPVGMRERFFEKRAPVDKDSGAGLGTYFTKLITEIQGGKIRMRTDETKGTEIVFSIPRGGAEG